MKFSLGTPHSRLKSRNCFRRTLLRRPLHKSSAINPVTYLDRISYGQNDEKSRKSFRRLLLRLFVPVSPLGAHSYEKIGGGGIFFSVTSRGPERPLCKLFGSNKFQAMCSAPLSNSFRIILLQKDGGPLHLSPGKSCREPSVIPVKHDLSRTRLTSQRTENIGHRGP
jgi:hypothetical protein